MVCKRKAGNGGATAKADKTSNACSDTRSVKKKMHSHTDNSNATEAMNIDNEVHLDSSGLPSTEVKSKVMNVVPRRSGRLINSVLPTWRKQVKPVVKRINLVGREKEREETPLVQQVNTLPVLNEKTMEKEVPLSQQVITGPVLNERNVEELVPQVQRVSTVSVVNERSLGEKVEYLVQAFGDFMSKTVKQVSKPPNEGPATYFSYKSLYINSQKKIEDLMEENCQLVKKLEFALGKIEAYEKMKDALCASKEVIILSSLEKSIEATVNLSPRQKCISPTVAAPDAAGQKCISPTVAAPDATGDPKTSPKPMKNNYKVAPNGHKKSLPKRKKSNYKKKKA